MIVHHRNDIEARMMMMMINIEEDHDHFLWKGEIDIITKNDTIQDIIEKVLDLDRNPMIVIIIDHHIVVIIIAIIIEIQNPNEIIIIHLHQNPHHHCHHGQDLDLDQDQHQHHDHPDLDAIIIDENCDGFFLFVKKINIFRFLILSAERASL